MITVAAVVCALLFIMLALSYAHRTSSAYYPRAKSLLQGRRTKDGATDTTINVLLVGTSGSGKSACANTLAGYEVFLENDESCSVSDQNCQTSVTLELGGEPVTVGLVEMLAFGSDQLCEEHNLQNLVHVLSTTDFSHVLFVCGETRFTKEQEDCYKFIFELFHWSGFSEEDVAQHITLVRTHSEFYRNSGKCETAAKTLKGVSPVTYQMVERINDVIYVDLPPSDFEYSGKVRQDCRQRLLGVLEKSERMLPRANLDMLTDRLRSYFNEVTCPGRDLPKMLESLQSSLESVKGSQTHFSSTLTLASQSQSQLTTLPGSFSKYSDCDKRPFQPRQTLRVSKSVDTSKMTSQKRKQPQEINLSATFRSPVGVSSTLHEKMLERTPEAKKPKSKQRRSIIWRFSSSEEKRLNYCRERLSVVKTPSLEQTDVNVFGLCRKAPLLPDQHTQDPAMTTDENFIFPAYSAEETVSNFSDIIWELEHL